MDEPTPTAMALDDFTAFLDEHRRCADLKAGVEEPEFGHQRLWPRAHAEQACHGTFEPMKAQGADVHTTRRTRPWSETSAH